MSKEEEEDEAGDSVVNNEVDVDDYRIIHLSASSEDEKEVDVDNDIAEIREKVDEEKTIFSPNSTVKVKPTIAREELAFGVKAVQGDVADFAASRVVMNRSQFAVGKHALQNDIAQFASKLQSSTSAEKIKDSGRNNQNNIGVEDGPISPALLDQDEEEEIEPGAVAIDGRLYPRSMRRAAPARRDIETTAAAEAEASRTRSGGEEPVANLVNDEIINLQVAEQVEASDTNLTGKMVGSKVFGCITCVIGLVVGVLVLVLMSSTNNEDPTGSGTLTGQDTIIDQAITTEDYVMGLLPAQTRARINLQKEEGNRNPQTRAFLWVLNDPYLAEYESWRIVQRFALVTFFHSTEGDTSWVKKTDWLSYEVEEYSWYFSTSFIYNPLFDGIPTWVTDQLVETFLASSESEEFSHLWLYSNNLRGSIPPELFLLTSLLTFDLASNRLTGSIPSEVGLATDLEIMAMFTNELTGKLPSQVGLMTNMVFLLTFLNDMSGTIPTELGLQSDVWVIHMDSNRHTGPIPSQLGTLTQMLGIHLYHNLLTSTIPTELGLMTALHLLEIDSNLLSGPIPSQLAHLNTITDYTHYVDYADHWFFGLGSLAGDEFVSWFSKGLALHDNALSGTFPTQLAQITRAIFLTAYSNYISGSIPSQLGSALKDLEALLLFDNALTSSIPESLGNLDKLVGMALSKNLLTGTIPRSLASMESLNVLWLQDNTLTGTIPQFSNQFVFDDVFPHDDLPSGLWERDISGAEMDLSRNHLVGSIPTTLAESKLIRLALSSNHLTGSVAPNLGRNGWLEQIYLVDNALTGIFPPRLCQLNSSVTPVFYCGGSLCGCSCPC